ANIVRGITFDTSEYSKYYQQALSLAVLNAGQKAETIANTLKVPLIKEPTLVAENTRESGGPIPFQPVAMVKSEASTPIQSSSMEIKSEVTAEFSYQPILELGALSFKLLEYSWCYLSNFMI